jgi:UDP-N-acetylglucosamine:LPS N-acetylglucosamine transferase
VRTASGFDNRVDTPFKCLIISALEGVAAKNEYWDMTQGTTRVLAVASGGGHWEQLMLLRPTLARYDVRFATTDPSMAAQHGVAQAARLPDCNQHRPFRAALCAVVALFVVLRHRPRVVVSTGAAPGFFCILAGRLIGARTLWIDSVANGQQLSMCGRLSLRFAHECWTQWEQLAEGPRPRYCGTVL